MDHNIGATVTYPPITPPTLPPINPIICNIDSNSFECIICGEGQGIGPVLSGKYGSASFTPCFNSIILATFSLVAFIILLYKFVVTCRLSFRSSRRRKSISLDIENGTSENNNGYSPLLDNDYNPYEDPQQVKQNENNSSNAQPDDRKEKENKNKSNVYNVGMYDFASANSTKNGTLEEDIEKKVHVLDDNIIFQNNIDNNGNVEVKQNDSPTAKAKESNSKNNSNRIFSSGKAAGPLLRGSRSYAKSIREVLELEMKKKEGWLVPRLLVLNSLLLCIISIMLVVQLSKTDIKHNTDSNDAESDASFTSKFINENENNNAIVLASNSVVPFLWVFTTYFFIRNIFGRKHVAWEPRVVASLLCFSSIFHIYNFIVPYFVGRLSLPTHALAIYMYIMLLLVIFEIFFIACVTLRHRSSPYYLMDAETSALLKLESTRKKGDTKPFMRLVILGMVDYAYLLIGCIGGLLATLSNIGWQVSFGELIKSSIHFDKPGVTNAVHLQILSCVALYCGNALQLCFVEAAGVRLVTRIQRFVFMAMMEQDMSFYDENKSGELTTMLSSNTALIRTGMTTQLAQALRGFFQFLIILVYLLVNSPLLTGIFLGSAFVPLFVLALTLTLISNIAKKSTDAQNVQGGLAQEFLAGIRTIVSFAMQEGTKERYNAAAWISNRLGVHLVIVQGLAFSFVIGGFYGALTVALWHGGNDIVNTSSPTAIANKAAEIIVFVNMAIAMVMGLGWIMSGLPEMAKAMGASEKIFEILDRQSLINYSGGKILSKVDGKIDIDRIKFSYPTRVDKVVLNDFTMSVKQGETIALVGGSGSGKSTVLSLIERFYDPQNGAILLDGVDMRILDPMWLRSQIGFVMQEPTLFAGTIADNIKFGCALKHQTVSYNDMVVAAKKANCHDFISKLPEKYDTKVGEQGTSLSGGQKQRIAIARAILKDPKILLLDEATSALDAESEYLVQEALNILMKGRTTLIVAHRLSTIRNANTIHVFDNGKIAESGSHTALLRLNGIYANLISKQSGPTKEKSKFSLGSVATPRITVG